MKNVLWVIVSLFLLAACEDGAYQAKEDKANAFATAHLAATGNTLKVVKVATSTKGYIVFEDMALKKFVAYNLTNWVPGVTDYEEYKSTMATTDYMVGLAKVTERYHNGDNWETEDVYYFGTYKFETLSSPTKDLELIAALGEDQAKFILTQRLQSEYALSSNRADKLAGLALKYKRLENLRALTVQEKNSFAMNALGVSFTDVETAVKLKGQGNNEAYDDVLITAASVNNTTPELIGSFLEDLAGNF